MLNHAPTFRQRCASALTHPVTVGALGVLLLNDLVFKALWSNPWTTGKLSDLAWLVFASPLLAFVLALLVRQNSRWQRAAWIAAYIGLPLLYAAFNTFPSVHDAILRGFSLVSGGTAGSPLDATDSLVIPVGLAVALWVWRRGNAGVGVLRQRLVLLTAGVAVVASVASTTLEPSRGITNVWITDVGSIIAATPWDQFESVDGGTTWYHPPRPSESVPGGHSSLNDPWPERHFEGSKSVESPAGWYEIRGNDVWLARRDGNYDLVYTAGFLNGSDNHWMQRQTTVGFGKRLLTTSLQAITYDPVSGNVLLAAGLQGAVVGTPDGEWTRVAVGSYAPVQSSTADKLRELLTDRAFWTTALALSLTVTALVTALAPLVSLIAGREPETTGWQALLGTFFTGLALIPTIILLATFASQNPLVSDHTLERAALMASTIVLVGLSITPCRGQLKYWRGIIPAFAGMILLTILAFVLWILGGFSSDFAKFASFVLVAVAGFGLLLYLVGKQPRDPESLKTSMFD